MSVELVEEGARGNQVGRAKALRKPPVHRPESLAGVAGACAVGPEPRQAEGAAQLPGQRAELARPVARFAQGLLGLAHRPATALRLEQLALHAQELRETPALLAGVAARKRVFDRREPDRGVAGAPE